MLNGAVTTSAAAAGGGLCSMYCLPLSVLGSLVRVDATADWSLAIMLYSAVEHPSIIVWILAWSLGRATTSSCPPISDIYITVSNSWSLAKPPDKESLVVVDLWESGVHIGGGGIGPSICLELNPDCSVSFPTEACCRLFKKECKRFSPNAVSLWSAVRML